MINNYNMNILKLLFFAVVCIKFAVTFISRERYEELKANVDFDVIEYETFLELFGDSKFEDKFKHQGRNHFISEDDKERLNKNLNSYKAFLNIDSNIEMAEPKKLPESFDWRLVYPICFYTPRQQGDCGSCYSFSATFALESRMCIKSFGKFPIRLSQQDLLSCDNKNQKCFGDTIVNTYSYLENYGVCSYNCKPYVSGNLFMPPCTLKCVNPSESFTRYRAYLNSFWASNDIDEIKNNLMNLGPLSTYMQTYEDMHIFRGPGIYEHKIGKQTDYHAIVIIGWGKDIRKGKEYWILRNSWGESWGDKGYFKVYFNDLEINEFVCASSPMI